MNIKTLVTGATGFIGRHLVEDLANTHNLRCLVRSNSNAEFLRAAGLETFVGDLNDKKSLVGALEGIDLVFHLAGAITGLSRSQFHRCNVIGCRNLANAARSSKQPPTIVYVSSMAAGGPSVTESARSEDETPAPVSHYGLTKLRGEYEFQKVADSVPITVVRPAIVYGEWDPSALEMFKPILKGWNFVSGNPDWPLSMIDVRDLVNLLGKAANGERLPSNRQEHGRGRYYATSPVSYSMREIGDRLAMALEVDPPKTIRIPAAVTKAYGALGSVKSMMSGNPTIVSLDKARELTRGPWHISGIKAATQLGFSAATPLEIGLKRVAQWYKKSGWI